METGNAGLKPIMGLARESWDLFRKRLGYYIAFTIVSGLVPLAAGFAGVMIGAGVGAVAGAATDVSVGVVIGGLFVVAGYLVAIYLGILFNLGLMASVADQQLTSIKEALRRVQPRVWQGVLVTLLVGIIVAIGTALLILPGIYFAVLYGFAMWTFLLEKKTGMDALNASKELVRGRWWSVFGLWFGFGVCLLVIVLLPQIILSMVGLDTIGVIYNLIASVFAGPVTIIFSHLLYQNLKQVKARV